MIYLKNCIKLLALFLLLKALSSCEAEEFNNSELSDCFYNTGMYFGLANRRDSTIIPFANEYYTDQLSGRWLLYLHINNQNHVKFLGHEKLYIELGADSSLSIFKEEVLISAGSWSLDFGGIITTTKLNVTETRHDYYHEIKSDISADYFPGRFQVCDNELRIFTDPKNNYRNNYSYFFVKQ